MIRNELKSVRIYQTRVRCYLETLEEKEIYKGRLVDQTIHRSDLGFIVDDPEVEEVCLFNPRNKVTENARIFIQEFGPYFIINCTDLFTDEAAHKVNEEHLSKMKNKEG